MRIVITGGAGFIGSHLAERLAVDQRGVVIFDNFTRGRRENLASFRDRVEIVDGDIRDRAALTSVLQGADLVFHLAAQSNVIGATQDLDYSFTTNVVGTYEVLRAAQAANVRRVVFTSSREVYGEPETLPVPESAPVAPKNAYGISKATGERYCELFAEAGLPVSILRLANVYGPRDFGRVLPIFLERAALQEPLVLYGGRQVLDLIWVGIVVDALLAAADGEVLPGPVNVGSGLGLSLMEVATRVIEATGSRSEIQVVPARSMEVVRFTANVEKGRALLGLPAVPDPLAWLERMCPPATAPL